MIAGSTLISIRCRCSLMHAICDGRGTMILSVKKKSGNLIDKLYGGLHMSWLRVIVFAVICAVMTAVFLIVPVFQNTSFMRMGVTLEAWIFFAVIIMANAESPMDSAMKTFAFFLISQPLIYLLQVLFSSLDWSIFRYYRYWFILTVLTFPAAYIGWLIRKKNWLSALILTPVLVFLAVTAYQSGLHCISHFPYLLVTCLFCILQIILYVMAFLSGKKRIAGIAIPVLAILIFAFAVPQADVNGTVFLPGDPVLSESAEAVMEEEGKITVVIEKTGSDSMVRVQAGAYGSADFRIQDGDITYLYTVEVFEDEGGHSRILITER